MKVAPVSAEMIATDAPLPEASRDVALPATSVPKSGLDQGEAGGSGLGQNCIVIPGRCEASNPES